MSKTKKAKKELTPEEKKERNRKRLENYNPVMAARNAWRREFSRSPTVIEMMNDPATKRKVPQFNKDGERAKIDATEHLCFLCKQWKRSGKKAGGKFAIDHINPVVDTGSGFVDFNTYFSRMWVAKDDLQKLCGSCHQAKTNTERFERDFPEELEIIARLELCQDKTVLRKGLQRFRRKKPQHPPYPVDFLERLEKLYIRLK